MSPQSDADSGHPFSSSLLESHRGYLRVLADLHLDRRLRGKLDASDIVQQTLLRGYQGLSELRNRSTTVVQAWLRQILAHELSDAIKHACRDRRNVAQERSLAAELDQSAAGFAQWLAASQTTPSQAAVRNEDLLQLANALLQLPVDQREAVILKHLKQIPLQQIAEETNRTPAAIAGLLRRGLAKLRQLLDTKDRET